MKSIICGAGAVGQSIAESLSKEGFDVTVIDESFELMRKISETLDVKTIVGTASLPSILESAGANNCDILIIGSGLTGLVTGYALSLLNFKIIIADQMFLPKTEKNFGDTRTTAISEGSKISRVLL